MKNVNSNQLQNVAGGLSSAEVATAAGLAGKTLVESLVSGYQGEGYDLSSSAISAAATFVGVYAGFTAYHLLAD